MRGYDDNAGSARVGYGESKWIRQLRKNKSGNSGHKNEGAARGTMRARDEEKNDGTDISIVIKLRIRVEITGNKAYHRIVHQ